MNQIRFTRPRQYECVIERRAQPDWELPRAAGAQAESRFNSTVFAWVFDAPMGKEGDSNPGALAIDLKFKRGRALAGADLVQSSNRDFEQSTHFNGASIQLVFPPASSRKPMLPGERSSK